MTKSPSLNLTREQMIQLLNEDLAGEYQAIIAYTVYSQVLKGAAYTDIARELELPAARAAAAQYFNLLFLVRLFFRIRVLLRPSLRLASSMRQAI